MEQKPENLSNLIAEHQELSRKMATIPSDKDMKTEIMDLMHKYNEIKDATQTVVGAIANVRGVTIKSVHLELNLPLDE